MIKKATKVAHSLDSSVITNKSPDATDFPAVTPTISFGLLFLRKKNGSMILQEGVNGVWVDVPMEIEQ